MPIHPTKPTHPAAPRPSPHPSPRQSLRRAPVLLPILFFLTLSACSAPQTPYRLSASFTDRFPIEAVAADHHLASAAGASILAQGGNAVDAAVATAFTLSVVRPYSSGLGGGGFMVIHLTTETLQRLRAIGRDVPAVGPLSIAINHRETTPRADGPTFYESHPDPTASTRGGAAVAVPGSIQGLLHAHQRFGLLQRPAVLQPAIDAARQGFTVDRHYLDSVGPLIRDFRADPALQTRFAFVWERFLRKGRVAIGDRITLPEQARALELIARDGTAALVNGPIGDAILRAVQADGGVLTRQDLADFTVLESEPLRFNALNRTFLTMPPPSSGGIALAQILAIVERNWLRAQAADAQAAAQRQGSALGRGTLTILDALTNHPTPRPTVQHLHMLAEAFKHAFADRARWLTDPAFNPVPTTLLLDPDSIDTLARTYDPQSVMAPRAYGRATLPGFDQPPPPPDDAGTSHLSVVDAEGSAVAATETINLVFGSLLAVPEFGFVLNNQMDDFNTRPSNPAAHNAFGLVQSPHNAPAWSPALGGKRPLSSMTPTIVLDQSNRVEAVAGASGGPRIITSTAQVLINAMLRGMTPRQALAAPRIHHQWAPDVLRLEPHTDRTRLQDALWEDDLRKQLNAIGHRTETTDHVGNVQAIFRDHTRGWNAASDPRKGGRPAGR